MSDLVAVLSPEFQFRAWNTPYRRESLESGHSANVNSWYPMFRPGTKANENLVPMRSRWVYGFMFMSENPKSSSRGSFTFDLELFVDDNGDVLWTPDLVSMDGQTRSWREMEPGSRPAPARPANDFVKASGAFIQVVVGLRNKASGKVFVSTRWAFLASSVRLPISALKAVAEWAPYWLGAVKMVEGKPELRDKDAVECLHRVKLPPSGTILACGVMDPLRSAPLMGESFRAFHDSLVAHTTPFDEQSPERRKETIDRVKKRLLAQALQAITASGRDKNDLRKRFKEDGKAVDNWLEDDRKVGQQLTRWVNESSADLAEFLRDPPFAEWEKAIGALYKDRMGEVLTCYSLALERVWVSTPGKALLAKYIADTTHWIYTYVLPEAIPLEEHIKLAQKVAPAILGLFEALAEVALKQGKTVEGLSKSLNAISGVELVQVKIIQAPAQSVVRAAGHRPLPAFTARTIVIKDEAAWAAWIKGPAEVHLNRFKLGLEVVTLYVAIIQVKSVEPTLQSAREVAAVISSLATTTAAFGSLVHWTRPPIKFAAGVGAVLDFACAAYDLNEMRKVNDYDAMIGQGIAAVGAACTLVGSYMMLTAPAAAPAPPLAVALEVVGGIVAAVGALIALLATDTDMQLLAAHCEFGEDSGDGSGTRPWSNGEFKDWRGNYDRQFSALMTLVASYTVEGQPSGSELIVRFGLLRPASRLTLRFDIEHDAGRRPDGTFISARFRPKILVDLGKQTAVDDGGTGSDRIKVTASFTEEDGRRAVKLRFERIEKQPFLVTEWNTVNVSAQLLLEGTSEPIPGNGKRVEGVTFDRQHWLKGNTIASKDVG